MDKKESSFMCLAGFECSLKDEKKQLHEHKILDSVLKSIYLKPCICLKSENVNIENEAKIFWIWESLYSKMREWTENELTSL